MSFFQWKKNCEKYREKPLNRKFQSSQSIKEQKALIASCDTLALSLMIEKALTLKYGKQKKKMTKCFRNRIYAQKSVKQWISS